MLIADGGGGYGGTNWNSKDVRAMWAAIADHNTDPHFDVVQGWSQTADLTLAHLGQVKSYRENLASVWPPSKSAASAAYIARLDKLIADLQATHDAAAANYSVFSTVTLTLSLARTKLKPILEQYEANELRILDWQAQQEATAAKSGKPSPSPSPRSTTPPVTSAQQEQLNNQARVIMYDLSSTLISGQAALKNPRPYDPAETGQGDGGEDRNNGVGGLAAPPPIPPPGSRPSRSASSPGSFASDPHDNPGAVDARTTDLPRSENFGVPDGAGGGPILSGNSSPPLISQPPGTIPSVAAPPLAPTAGQIGIVPGTTFPSGNGGAIPPSTLAPGRASPSKFLKSGVSPVVGPSTPFPGGVIGAPPGGGIIGRAPQGPPSSGRSALGRPNPVGGVIGQPQDTASARGDLKAAAVNAGQTGTMTGRQGDGRTRCDGKSRRWDRDNPWETAKGVDPVVLPPDDPGPIDPGPAIGYPR
ncbi:hypothetical protein [Couchioplanes azureus]|uniref:hypothetical protein n=1 Tax=Couchioplanes caeruleus TaxID=56438 RepID=UPI00167175D6|nr:hypothetical protein [Couchioplanes caeruleus]GGQ41228.1 hypothetical protein GCM10010166_05760 [Couchioplanes caeruleus subsp. azureus]